MLVTSLGPDTMSVWGACTQASGSARTFRSVYYMDDSAWVVEIAGSAVVWGGSVALGLAFRSAPLLTVLGSLLLVLLVGSSLFVYLSRRSDSGLTRRRLALVVVLIMAMSLGGAVVIWIAYFSDLLA